MGAMWMFVGGMLLFGTVTSVSMKVMLQVKAAGYMGVVHEFDKPFMQSFLMFFGMAFSLLIARIWDPENGRKPQISEWRQRMIISIPTAFDLFASTLMTFGLIYINVSIFQMLRGSMVVFSTILSIIFLKKKIKSYEWIGISMSVAALIMIGIAGCNIPSSGGDEGGDGERTVGEKILGSVLVILSQLVQAAQIVAEEFVLKDVNVRALDIVGWEGLWGTAMMVLIAFPFAFIIPGKDASPLGTSLENFMDSAIQLFTNGKIAGLCALFVVAVLGLNMFGMLVTAKSGAINRTIIEAARTLLIWASMLIAEKLNVGFGEPWVSWSWLELAGFIVLVSATFVYNCVVKIPGLSYESEPLATYE